MPSSDTQAHAAYRPPPLITLSGALVSHIHTFFGFLAFGGALLTALTLHYHKVVKNGIAGWPYEYWPSVSATIGDWYPERNIFQIGIALMSGPRFALVLLSSLLVSLSKPASSHARILAVVGCLRTFACGGWVYVTSTDDHDVHDVMMGLYLVLTPPWMFITSGSLAVQPNKESALMTTNPSSASRDALAAKARKMRRLAAGAFFGMTPFMVLFFYRHKVLRIPGAYSHYAIFEWGLIIFDLLFDCASMYDLSRLEIQIVESRVPAAAKDEVGKSQPLIGGFWTQGGTNEAVLRGAWSTPPVTARHQGDAHNVYPLVRSARNGPLRATPERPSALREAADFTADCYIGFLFWTSLTALHPEIFFFSVYNMGMGGHEALLVIQLIALGFALIPPVRRWLMPGSASAERDPAVLSKPSKEKNSTRVVQQPLVGQPRLDALAVLYLFCLLGFVVWPITNRLVRLVATSLSCVGFSVLTAITWGRAWEIDSLERETAPFILGLLLSSLAKYANHSNNPAWSFVHKTNGGQNAIALLLALAAVTQRLRGRTRHLRSQPHSIATRNAAAPISQRIAAVTALGALLFILHVALSDSGTLIAWTWTGYPVTGPMALQHGWIVLSASCLSLAISQYLPHIALSPPFWVFGLLSFYIVYAFENWVGFAGAVGVALFLPPLATPLVRVALQGHPLKTMWLVWLVTDICAFLQILTAAYAFVPGAKIMRERLGLMLSFACASLLLGLNFARRGSSTRSGRLASKSVRKFTAVAAVAICVAAQIVAVLRGVPPTAIKPHFPNDRVFTAGIWTVHFSLDQLMWDSSRRMASLIDDLQLDVVGLLETDLHRTVFGNRDLTQYLSDKLGMYADIGPGPDKHTWGAALLSKFPIVNTTHHLLPSPNGELAPAIHAVLDIYGVQTHVVVSHNGQEEDALDRELQTTELAGILREAYPHPAVFLGYVVTDPHAPRPNPYEILFTDGRILDVEPHDMDRWCQYIGFRGVERVAYARVSRFDVTDTEMQTAKFRMPPPEGPPIDPDHDVLPFKSIVEPSGKTAWIYPRKFIDPPAKVYNKHKYSPVWYPLYFRAQQN